MSLLHDIIYVEELKPSGVEKVKTKLSLKYQSHHVSSKSPKKAAIGRPNAKSNFMSSYSKSKQGKLIKATKMNIELQFLVENVQYTFTIVHSLITGKYELFLDGSFVLSFKNFLDSGIIYNHRGGLEGREVVLRIEYKTDSDIKHLIPLFNYDVFIDGVSAKELKKERDYMLEETKESTSCA